MSGGFASPLVGGGGALEYPSVHSPDYVPGVTGWYIGKDGSAEFNNLDIRGTFHGNDFEINTSGAFFYSGAAGPGTLLVSIAAVAGYDPYGNYYRQGFSCFNPGTSEEVNINDGFTSLYDSAGNNWGLGPLLIGGLPYLEIFTPGAGLGQLYIDQNAILLPNSGVAAATPEGWHSLGAFSSALWTVNTGRYRLTPEGYCRIDIALTANAATAAGVFTWAITPPAPYRFPGNYTRAYAAGFNGTITTATNNADVLVDGAGTSSPGRIRVQLPALPAGTSMALTVDIPLS